MVAFAPQTNVISNTFFEDLKKIYHLGEQIKPYKNGFKSNDFVLKSLLFTHLYLELLLPFNIILHEKSNFEHKIFMITFLNSFFVN